MSSYLALVRSGTFARRVEQARAMLRECHLCGWHCGVDRAEARGPCRTGLTLHAATAYRHFGEERPLVGKGGSGAIFFSSCVMQCVFCQTARWSIQGQGHPLEADELAALMLDLQHAGAENINLVTPTHVLPQILEAVYLAAQEGLRLPLVWNSGGYESAQALALLDGIVDIYLPDMKYGDPALAHHLSGVSDYPTVNRQSVLEMARQVGHLEVGHLEVGPDGAARRGLLIRHLVMPGHFENTNGVLHWIAENLGPETYLSLMDQYRPAHRAADYPGIDRAITPQEYAEAVAVAHRLGLRRLDDHLTPPEEDRQ
jgi:putative pyruvate formate lyase activating enzyme